MGATPTYGAGATTAPAMRASGSSDHTGWQWSAQPEANGVGAGGPLRFTLGGPAYLPYRDGRPVPAGYEIEETARTTPLVVGGLMLAIPYAAGLGIAGSESFAHGSGWLAAPVVGPWAALTKRPDPCDGVDGADTIDSDVGRCVAEPMVRGLLVLDGVIQATGAVLLIVGSGKDKRLVRSDLAVAVSPRLVGHDGYGLGAFGSF